MVAHPGLHVGVEIQIPERRVNGRVGEVDAEQLAHVGEEAMALLRRKVGVLGYRIPEN